MVKKLLPNLTTEEKLDMTLDDIINYENKQEILYLKSKISDKEYQIMDQEDQIMDQDDLIRDQEYQIRDQEGFIKSSRDLKYNVISLYDWIIHIDRQGLEYVIGEHEYKNKLWETSTIRDKIPMSNYLLIVTENETLYRLPYYSSYK